MNYLCKTIITGCLFMLMIRQTEAQTIVHIGAGGQLFISAKTTVSLDSFVMVPSGKGLLLGENDISKLSAPVNPFPGTYLPRVYCFSHLVANYDGSFGIFYNANEAAGLDADSLLMQSYNAGTWQPLDDTRTKNPQRDGIGVLKAHRLSFSELLLGYNPGDPDAGRLSIAFAPAIDAGLKIALYPNPAVNVVNVQVNGSMPVKSVQLYDASGKLLIIKAGNIGNRYEFNVSHLASGFYNILVETKDGKQLKRFIKQ